VPGGWSLLLELTIALAAAFVVGALFERLRMSAMLGYILAGLIIGPQALGAVNSIDAVTALAEIGVALLLFSIGLEFSWSRLKRMGRTALVGGLGQILLTSLVAAGIASAFGVSLAGAIAIGGILAMSSTAVVVRTLQERREMDSNHGRNAVGVLLMQDLAIVPFVLVVAALSSKGPAPSVEGIALAAAKVTLAALSFAIVLLAIIPRVLRSRTMAMNRDLPILVAITSCVGAAWAAHAVGLSASLGAFLAGMLLAETSFAEQIRSDVGPLRVLFVTLFFSSIGMLADPRVLMTHPLPVVGLVVVMISIKAVMAFVAIRLSGQSIVSSLATGVTLAQVGELAFLLLALAGTNALLTATVLQVLTLSAVSTLLISPFLVARAEPIARRLSTSVLSARRVVEDIRHYAPRHLTDHVVIFGYGNSGQAAAEQIESAGYVIAVLDSNRASFDAAKEQGYAAVLGEATMTEAWEHLSMQHAAGVVITVPDPHVALRLTRLVRAECPNVRIVVRSRFQMHVDDLVRAGANQVVDEETLVGNELGSAMRRMELVI
jgi:CPA2 family monovalent cation:H+ antiporter-2